MKRIVSTLLLAVLILGGCAGTPTASPAPAATLAATAQPATAAPTATLEETATPTASPTATATPVPTPTPPASFTSGVPSLLPYKPVGIMIENRPEARPQSGLSQADVVYEAFMEGKSVTRFFCVFNDQLPANVGPVRSCRIYFIDIAQEYKGMLAFFGGPNTEGNPASIYGKLNKAKLQIKADGIGSKYNKYFWRIKERKAPHNVYTDVSKLSALLQPMDPVKHFNFDANAVPAGEDISTIQITYNRNIVDNKYVYDPANRNYKRYIGGEPMMDALTNQQVTVTNVVVQNAKLTFLGTSKGHINIKLIGSGDADIFTGGKHIKATWKRANTTDTTHYYDKDGKEITLLPGNTWVQVVDKSVPVKYTK